jgi:hypothetical protein
VKYVHAGLSGIVVAKGCYFFDTARWMARHEPDEYGGRKAQVHPMSWATVQPGVKPWDGGVIRARLGDRMENKG